MSTLIILEPSRPIDLDTFADITTVPVATTHWVEVGLAGSQTGIAVEFNGTPTANELTLCRIRGMTRDAAQEALWKQAIGAYLANATYLAIAAPTTAQAVTQVKALTQQVQALLRIAVPLDS